MRTAVSRQTDRFDAANREAAAVILASPERHNELAVQWARRVMARHHADAENREAPRPAEQRQLFEKDR